MILSSVCVWFMLLDLKFAECSKYKCLLFYLHLQKVSFLVLSECILCFSLTCFLADLMYES